MSSTAPAASFEKNARAPQRSRMTEREKFEGRLAAAKVNGGAAAAVPRGNDRYTVEGRAGARYTVQAFGLERYACDCPAGIKGGGTACWHTAATYLRIIADRSAAATSTAA